ncbi:hypothetical protein [Streptomyces sp. NBC_01314]|uniref:hypothetical protein n=1 Tax=Streptomyces sp. NBC_01314 TaxID=2903821 RepID=UPI003092E9EB|nr:hypothetical protein OG622_23335 [Streptomyces sp. NBC_01314]
MHLVSRALAWTRAVLFGLPETDDRRPPPDLRNGTYMEATPSLPARCPSPEMCAAFLPSARRRGTSTPRSRTELPVITADDINSTLVGAYLLPPEAHQRIRQAQQFAEAS